MKRYLAFLKVVETRSFSKAADEMGYTQSAVSQMISSLEDELSIKLLNRTRQGALLTIEGRDLYPFLEKAAYDYMAVSEKASEIKGLESGTIRMGTLASISAHWLPNLIRDFQEEYPRVDFVIHQGDYTSIQDWIKSGAIDFGFVNPPAVSGIETKVIKDGSMLAVLPKGHPLARKKRIPLKDLIDDPFILLEEGHYYEPLLAFEEKGLSPNIKYTIHDDYAIMTMVESGLGISILADLVLQKTSYDIVLRETVPKITRTIAFGYRSEANLPLAARRFMDYLMSRKDELL